MSLVSIGEAELYMESHGDGDVVLLAAGLGGSGTFWVNQIELLSQEFRVVLYDHRGVGRSGAAPLINNTSAMADDLLSLMDVLEIDSAHLVGHSTGGAIGQHIALRAPERLKSLVLSASWPGPTPLFVATFDTRRDVLVNSGVLDYMMVGTLLACPAWWLQERFESAEQFLQSRIDGFPGLETELGRLNAVMTHDLRHEIANIRTPTTVICARDDQLTPPGMSAELAERIPHAQLRMLERGGHFAPVTVSGNYNQVLLKALRES